MGPLELRNLICNGLNRHRGDKYQQILDLEKVSPVPGEPVALKAVCPDHNGELRTFWIEIIEE
ncbi:hypothetical protein [Streptomyces sp. UNOC14_S4]|uniref:hypothetical protein n=1 Tax=Streptomyces sp. UNOC14_S4 TaxID=2872340 RepID=UPI001E3A86B1|nr:hypothetical protein [Streptomyces sp. UNOC14_S4]MCC3766479.1 hypothetical protein [Streptomyces sp. UNOC14_S4]